MKGYVVCVYKSIGDEKLLKKYAESAIPAIENTKAKYLLGVEKNYQLKVKNHLEQL